MDRIVFGAIVDRLFRCVLRYFVRFLPPKNHRCPAADGHHDSLVTILFLSRPAGGGQMYKHEHDNVNCLIIALIRSWTSPCGGTFPCGNDLCPALSRNLETRRMLYQVLPHGYLPCPGQLGGSPHPAADAFSGGTGPQPGRRHCHCSRLPRKPPMRFR